MKNKLTIALIAAALTLTAATTAQQIIDFNQLPLTGAQLPIPSGYAGMNWNDLYYTTLRSNTGLRNVAVPGFGSGAQSMVAANPGLPFRLLGIAAKGAYGTTLTLFAYNRGAFVGSQRYALAPVFTPLPAPSEWGPVTQITFVCRDAQQRAANFNLYSLTLQ